MARKELLKILPKLLLVRLRSAKFSLQDLQKENRNRGKGDNGLQDILNQMDKVETDLVNKRLNAESLARQKTYWRDCWKQKRLKDKRMDEKRKAETGEEKQRPVPPALQEYLKKGRQKLPCIRPYPLHWRATTDNLLMNITRHFKSR